MKVSDAQQQRNITSNVLFVFFGEERSAARALGILNSYESENFQKKKKKCEMYHFALTHFY